MRNNKKRENDKIEETAENAYESAVLVVDSSGMAPDDKDIALLVSAKIVFFTIAKVGCTPRLKKLARAMLDAWDREMQEEKVLQ